MIDITAFCMHASRQDSSSCLARQRRERLRWCQHIICCLQPVRMLLAVGEVSGEDDCAVMLFEVVSRASCRLSLACQRWKQEKKHAHASCAMKANYSRRYISLLDMNTGMDGQTMQERLEACKVGRATLRD
jgi:hypothetical protein